MGVSTSWDIRGVFTEYSWSIRMYRVCIGYVSGMYRECIERKRVQMGSSNFMQDNLHNEYIINNLNNIYFSTTCAPINFLGRFKEISWNSLLRGQIKMKILRASARYLNYPNQICLTTMATTLRPNQISPHSPTRLLGDPAYPLGATREMEPTTDEHG